jgi:hypothetical protein
VMDQLRVALVHAPDVSARTAIVRESRVLARERQIFGGILPTRRTGRNQHVGTSLFSARTVPAEPSDLAPHCAPSGHLQGRSRGKRSLSSTRRHWDDERETGNPATALSERPNPQSSREGARVQTSHATPTCAFGSKASNGSPAIRAARSDLRRNTQMTAPVVEHFPSKVERSHLMSTERRGLIGGQRY